MNILAILVGMFSTIAIVIVVVVTERSFVANEEARLPVAPALRHFGQREGNPPHPVVCPAGR